MNRAGALAWLQASGINALMTQAGRTTDDTSTGYGPALDQAFTIHGITYGLPEPYDAANVPAAQQLCFTALLRASAYDILMPAFSAMVDANVDAPLTGAKFSQMFKQVSMLREEAWREASACGYGIAAQASGYRVNLDFLEPPEPRSEFG
jgi:hypothetical protein